MAKKTKKAHGFGMRDLEDPSGVAPGLFQTPTSGRPPSFSQSQSMTTGGNQSTGYSPTSVSRSTTVSAPSGVGSLGSRAVASRSVGSGTVNSAPMAVSSARRTSSYAGSVSPAANATGPDNATIQASRPRRSVTESGTTTMRTSRVTGTAGVRSNTPLGKVMGAAKNSRALPNPVGATLIPMAAPTAPSATMRGEKRREKEYSVGMNPSHGFDANLLLGERGAAVRGNGRGIRTEGAPGPAPSMTPMGGPVMPSAPLPPKTNHAMGRSNCKF